MATQQWTPGDLLEVSGFFWKTAALHAAVKLDVFTVIGDLERSPIEVAQRLEADPKSVTRFLDALVAMELLVKIDGRYTNTESSRVFLTKSSPQYLGHIMTHHHHLVESWSNLDQAVKTGSPIRNRSSFSEDEWREGFLMGMFNLAMGLAPQIVPRLDLSSCRRLLDLGGGPGTYAIHFCLNNPHLKADVYDLPSTRPFAEKTINKFDLANRIKFIDGNYLEDPIPGSYDVAWLSQILHAEGPSECRSIIQKTVGALEPNGLIIIHEFILNNSLDGPLFPALFSLNMLLGTESGQSYSEQQLTGMLKDAGVRDVRRIQIESPNDSGLLVGNVEVD